MIIVDRALQERERSGRPVRVGMIGAGAMGRAITNQIVNAVPGMRLVAISNRHPQAAVRAYTEAGIRDVATVDTVTGLEGAIAAGRAAVTDDPTLLCRAGPIDALIEVTGSIDFAAGVVLDGIAHGHHQHLPLRVVVLEIVEHFVLDRFLDHGDELFVRNQLADARPLVESAHALHQQTLRAGLDHLASPHRAEHDLELALAPGQ